MNGAEDLINDDDPKSLQVGLLNKVSWQIINQYIKTKNNHIAAV